MKTNVTCSLETRLVEDLDAWRAPMRVSRSGALELLIESIAEGAGEAVTPTSGVYTERSGVEPKAYFDSNGVAADPGVHHDNPKFDMVVPAPGTRADVADTEPPTGDTFVSEESHEGSGPVAREVEGVEGPSSIGSARKPAKPSRR